MPRSPRLLAKRRLEQARTNLSWVAYHLIEVHKMFENGYPEHYEQLTMLINALAEIDKAIDSFNQSI